MRRDPSPRHRRGPPGAGRATGRAAAQLAALGLALPAAWAQEVGARDGEAPGAAAAGASAPAEAEEPGDVTGWRVARWTCLISGGITLGVGGALLGLGHRSANRVGESERDELGRIVEITQRDAARTVGEAQDQVTLGAVTMGIGGALVVTGLLLWLFEPPAAPRGAREAAPEVLERPYSLVPFATPDGLGAAWTLRF